MMSQRLLSPNIFVQKEAIILQLATSKSNRKTEGVPSKIPSHLRSPPKIPTSLSEQKFEICAPPNEIISDVVGKPQEIENQLCSLDPNKAQLLLLLQMQQIVQKMEEYENTTTSKGSYFS